MVWLILLVWTVMVASLLPTGSALHFKGGHPLHRYGAAVTNHTELSARVRTGVFAAFAVMPLVFVFAVRNDVGTDYQAYVEIFQQFRTGAPLLKTEPLYGLLNRVMSPFGSFGVVAVFAVSAAISALPLFFRVFRSSPTPWLGTLILFGLGFPFFMTNGVRSAIAIGIVMLVLPAIGSRQVVLWSLGILLAAGFHFTALLVWPIYWVLHLAWPRVLALGGLAAAVMLSVNRELAVSFLQWVPAIIPSEYAHYPDIVLEKLVAYEFGFGYLIYVALTCLILVIWDRARNEGRETLVFRNAAILGLVMLIALYQFWAVNRLALFFTPALAIFLPWVAMHCAERRERVLWAAGLVALFGMMFLRGLLGGAHDAVPYHWIF